MQKFTVTKDHLMALEGMLLHLDDAHHPELNIYPADPWGLEFDAAQRLALVEAMAICMFAQCWKPGLYVADLNENNWRLVDAHAKKDS